MRAKQHSHHPAIGLLVCAVLMAADLLLPQSSLAHKVYLFAWPEGKTVQCEAYFSKSRKVKGGRIRALDASGREIARGTTDDRGRWSFSIDRRTDIHLELDAGMGHQAVFLIEADELPPDLPAPAAAATSPKPAVDVRASTQSESGKALQTDEEMIRRVVESALDERLQPLQRAVAHLAHPDQGPKLKDIIGGLGWIFGIMGLVILLRRKNK